MNVWTRITVGELIDKGEASLQTGPFGTQFKASEYVDFGIPMVNVKNIGYGDLRTEDLDYLDEKTAHRLRTHRLRTGDIVFGRKGSADRHALIGPAADGWLQGSDCMRLRLNSNQVTPHFLSYYFRTSGHKYWMEAVCAFGATMSTLNQGIVRRITLLVPHVEVQNKISAVLSTYDQLIEKNSRRIVLLDHLAEEVYREWFVRFRFPGHEKATFVKGIPETWDIRRFGKFCMLKRGYDLPDKHVVQGDYPVMASTSIKTYHNEFKAEPPVITTGRSGSLGTVLLVHSKAWPLNTALYVKDCFKNSPYLVFYTLKNMGLGTFNSGAGVPTLNRNHLNGIKIAVPDKDLQERFDAIVSPFHEQKEQIRKTNAILVAAQQSLLIRLISGKLSVDNLDIRFPPSMSEKVDAESAAVANA